MKDIIDRLAGKHDLNDEEFERLILCDEPEANDYLTQKADEIRQKVYGKDVYLRAVIWDMIWGSGPLCCRVEKIRILMMTDWSR